MCGIAGIVNLTERGETPPAGLLARMIGMIRHRGPDEYGMYRRDRTGLLSHHEPVRGHR